MARNRRLRKRHPLSLERASGWTALAAPARNRRASRKNARKLRASLLAESLPQFPALPDSVPLTWIKFAIGLILLPLCWISSEAAFHSFAQVTVQSQFWRTPEFWFFGMGSLMWIVVFAGMNGRALLFLYVLGHECTHALFALLCGARIERVEVTAEGGHILTDKNNVLISLSPYFVPFYTVLCIGAYTVARLFFDLGDVQFRILFALIGLTWTFHLTFTLWMILKNQPDLRQNGTFFSLTLIYLVNLLIIVGMLVVASPALALRDFTTTWLTHAYTLGPRTGEAIGDLVQSLASKL